MKSIWSDNCQRRHFRKLTESISTDVLIIGGGLTGILCAYTLKNQGIDCVLAEAKYICSGTTENTTAKITFQHGLFLNKLIKKYGTDNAFLYLKSQKEAIEEYERLSKNIDCDYEKKDAFVYTRKNPLIIEDEVRAYEKAGIKAFYRQSLPLPFSTEGAAGVRNQAQFNPMKFIYGITENLPIYENTKIKELMPGKAITQCGEIRFRKCIVATHFPILNKHGGYSLKMYQHRSYVIVVEGAENPDGMYIDENNKGFSFRSYKNTLLIGGGSHRTGKNGGRFSAPEAVAEKYYPYGNVLYRWSAQDCMTLDGIPYIGLYSVSTPDLFVATGYNKWGVTSSMVAAKMLCSMIKEESTPYSELYNPSRSILTPQLAINAYETLAGFIRPTTPRCPHLGCALIYNPQEHSWDCPCHGSRFTKEGELIDNPATDDLK